MATEKRLIDKDALIALCDAPHWCVWMSEIEDFPTIDAVEAVHGRWIKHHSNRYECNCCNVHFITCEAKDWNYCPNCGAKKDGDGNG